MYCLINIHRSILRNKRSFSKNWTAVIVVIHVHRHDSHLFSIFGLRAELNMLFVFEFFLFFFPLFQPVSSKASL